jgi:hypothetical protein
VAALRVPRIDASAGRTRVCARCIGRMSGQGKGCTTVQANPTRERTQG